MGKYIDKNNILSLDKDGRVILEDDDTITDDALLFAHKNNINVYKLSRIKHKSVERVIVAVVGSDSTGIISDVTTICKESQINILDINQTVLQGDFFTMAMVVDINDSNINLEIFKTKLLDFGKEKQLKINVQHEDLFNFMHRI